MYCAFVASRCKNREHSRFVQFCYVKESISINMSQTPSFVHPSLIGKHVEDSSDSLGTRGVPEHSPAFVSPHLLATESQSRRHSLRPTSFVKCILVCVACDCAHVCASFFALSCEWLILTRRILTECWAIPGGTRPRGLQQPSLSPLFSPPLRSRKSESSLVLHATHLSV